MIRSHLLLRLADRCPFHYLSRLSVRTPRLSILQQEAHCRGMSQEQQVPPPPDTPSGDPRIEQEVQHEAVPSASLLIAKETDYSGIWNRGDGR